MRSTEIPGTGRTGDRCLLVQQEDGSDVVTLAVLGPRGGVLAYLDLGPEEVERLRDAIRPRGAAHPGTRLTTADVRRLLDDRWDS